MACIFNGAPRLNPIEVEPVAVTRWSARLADPQCEHDYRLDRFEADRRRMLLLTGFGLLAGILNLLLEYRQFSLGLVGTAAFATAFASILLPLLGFSLTLRMRSPVTLEALVVVAISVGSVTRFSQLTMHPGLADLWTTMMVGLLFVIYLYLPIRLGVAVALAAAFSLVAPIWWSLAQGSALHPELFYRALVVLVVVNALGFAAANSIHRSQRMQFAQRLVLQQLLSTDAMTGIANRRHFDAALEREWRRCQRAGAPLSLLMIDVDHFKAYNDHCGHPQGDACLRQVAQLLVEAVGRPGDLVARYGGEEFVCLMPDVSGGGALTVANKLMATLRAAGIIHPRSPAGPRLTISIGVATVKDLSGQPEQLVEYADQLLYAAKAAGRNQVKVGRLAAETVANAA